MNLNLTKGKLKTYSLPDLKVALTWLNKELDSLAHTDSTIEETRQFDKMNIMRDLIDQEIKFRISYIIA